MKRRARSAEDKTKRRARLDVYLAGFLAVTTLALWAGFFKREKPNIILITLDTTRADHFSCYGYPHKTTPNIDRLAETGVRWDFVIAQSSITPISCASQLSGTYPYRHGLRAMHGYDKYVMINGVPALPGELRRLGYKTAGFVSAFPASSRWGLARGFDRFDEEFLKYRHAPKLSSNGMLHTRKSQRTAAETNKKVLPWLRKNADKTFFAWVHYFDPHDTHFVPPQSVVNKFIRATREEDKDEYLRSVYDAEIYFADMQIGRIVKELEKLGIREKTILIITADHGEGLGDHNWWIHAILYQEQIRAPLIMNGPGIPRGVVRDAMVEHVDLLPTILELAEPGSSGQVKGVQGRNILPLMRDGDASTRKKDSYSEVHNYLRLRRGERNRARGVMFSLIRDGWKFIHHPNNPAYDEIYNLQKDPRELRNVINDNRATAKTFLAELRSRGALKEYKPKNPVLSGEDYQHLKALGYVE